jgi:ABC-type transport system involved in multi-copper enzyme maturation permease subunit
MTSPPIRRLVWVELRRFLDRRALLVALGLTGLGIFTMRIPLSGVSSIHGVWTTVDNPIMTTGAIVVAIAVASGALAEDRHTRYTRLFLVRGYSRRAYVLAKALAVAVSTGLVTCAGLTGFLILARLRLPLDAWMMATWRDFLLPPVLMSLATSALALIGVLAGAVSKSVWVAYAAPLAVLVASALFLPRSTVNPAAVVEAWRNALQQRPFVLPAHLSLLYWAAFGGLMALLSSEIFARTEED